MAVVKGGLGGMEEFPVLRKVRKGGREGGREGGGTNMAKWT